MFIIRNKSSEVAGRQISDKELIFRFGESLLFPLLVNSQITSISVKAQGEEFEIIKEVKI